MTSNWSLSDSKSLQVTRTILSILADLDNILTWMVSSNSLISKSSSPCSNSVVTVPSAPVKNGITVTSILHSFFQFSSKVYVLLSIFAFFQFQVERQSSQSGKFVFFFRWLSPGLVVWSRSGDPFVSQILREVFASPFSERVLGCAYTIYSYGQISVSCIIPKWSPCLPSRVQFYTLFVLVYGIAYYVIDRFICITI